MKLQDLINIIYNSKDAAYHIKRQEDDKWYRYTYEQVYKNHLQEREIAFIENFSPDKYRFNNWWICLKSE